MSIFGRIFRIIKGWLLIGVEKAEDPEVILAEAQESMRRELDRAKENAVQAIAARNQLRQVLQEQQNQAAGLEAKARRALMAGQEDLARQLLVEKGTYDQNIANLQGQLEQAERSAEAVKAGIKQMEQKVRERAAQALALKAGWKQAKIQEQLNRALSEFTLENQEQAFGRAEERIRALQAKAEARSELSEGTLARQMAQLDALETNSKANDALEAMKREMGYLPPTTAEDPLARLKADMATEKNEQKEEPQVRNLEV